MNNLNLSNCELPQILETGYFCATNPFFHASRTLSFHVMIFVLEGVIYVTEDGTDYAVKRGQLLFLKAGIHHYGKIEIPKKTKWYYIHFNLNQKKGVNNCSLLNEIPKFTSGLSGSDIEKLISLLVNDFHSPDPSVLWSINVNFFKLLTDLIQTEQGIHPVKSTVAGKIAAYLEAHYTDSFDIKKMEDLFCLSYKRMAALFKQEKGCSMLQFHTQCRIKQACRLLILTDLNIGEIAVRTGFEDQLYFSRIFHQYKKMSPKEWRKHQVFREEELPVEV